jgi:catechol 2,3-dioxygenase
MTYQPAFGDIAHVGHVELLTASFEASLDFFTEIVGLHEAGRHDDSVYLRAWGDYERFTLQLTKAKTSGLGHAAFRAKDPSVLDQLVANLKAHSVGGVRCSWSRSRASASGKRSRSS